MFTIGADLTNYSDYIRGSPEGLQFVVLSHCPVRMLLRYSIGRFAM